MWIFVTFETRIHSQRGPNLDSCWRFLSLSSRESWQSVGCVPWLAQLKVLYHLDALKLVLKLNIRCQLDLFWWIPGLRNHWSWSCQTTWCLSNHYLHWIALQQCWSDGGSARLWLTRGCNMMSQKKFWPFAQFRSCMNAKEAGERGLLFFVKNCGRTFETHLVCACKKRRLFV